MKLLVLTSLLISQISVAALTGIYNKSEGNEKCPDTLEFIPSLNYTDLEVRSYYNDENLLDTTELFINRSLKSRRKIVKTKVTPNQVEKKVILRSLFGLRKEVVEKYNITEYRTTEAESKAKLVHGVLVGDTYKEIHCSYLK